MTRIPERQLEDWIIENLDSLSVPLCNYSYPSLRLIDHQIALPNGILDILAVDVQSGYTYVIELKVVPIREKHLGQALRYSNDVRRILRKYCYETERPEHCTFTTEETFSRWQKLHNIKYMSPYPIIPVLIGKSVDKNLLSAADGAYATVLTWECDGDRFLFQRHWRTQDWFDGFDHADICVYADWVKDTSAALLEHSRLFAEDRLLQEMQGLFGQELEVTT